MMPASAHRECIEGLPPAPLMHRPGPPRPHTAHRSPPRTTGQAHIPARAPSKALIPSLELHAISPVWRTILNRKEYGWDMNLLSLSFNTLSLDAASLNTSPRGASALSHAMSLFALNSFFFPNRRRNGAAVNPLKRINSLARKIQAKAVQNQYGFRTDPHSFRANRH
jgi:hypothetical protein